MGHDIPPLPGLDRALKAPAPILLHEVGEFEKGDGIRVTLQQDELIVEVATSHLDAALGVPVVTILEAIALITKAGES